MKREQAPRGRATRNLREELHDRIRARTRSIFWEANILDSTRSHEPGDSKRDIPRLAMWALVRHEKTSCVSVPMERVEMPICTGSIKTGNEQMTRYRHVRG